MHKDNEFNLKLKGELTMKTKKECDTCEFNAGTVCMGYGKRTDNKNDTYGMPIEEAKKMFPNGCDDWGISIDAFFAK